MKPLGNIECSFVKPSDIAGRRSRTFREHHNGIATGCHGTQFTDAVVDSFRYRIVPGKANYTSEYGGIPNPLARKQDHFAMHHGCHKDIQERTVVGNDDTRSGKSVTTLVENISPEVKRCFHYDSGKEGDQGVVDSCNTVPSYRQYPKNQPNDRQKE